MKTPQLSGLLAAGLLMAATTVAEAQVTIGPRVGLNFTNLKYNIEDADDIPESKYLPGAQVGFAVNMPFGNLALQPALLFSMKGDKNAQDENETNTAQGYTTSYKIKSSSTTRLNYLELPVTFVYSTKGAEGGFQVFAGSYLALGLGGKYKGEYDYSSSTTYNGQVIYSDSESDSYSTEIKFAGKEGDDDKPYIRNLDAGFNVGLGYKVGGAQAQLGYGLGVGNLIPNDEDDNAPEDKVHNRGFHLSLTYFFGAE